jgi:hypothetical protein
MMIIVEQSKQPGYVRIAEDFQEHVGVVNPRRHHRAAMFVIPGEDVVDVRDRPGR